MIILSFDEFDRMNNEAEETMLPDEFEYPPIKEVETKLGEDDSYLQDVLVMLVNCPYADYRKKLNRILTDMVFLTEEEIAKPEETESDKIHKMILSVSELQEMTDKVKNMDFQCTYWYPSVLDLKKRDFKPCHSDVCFLLWLINTELELTSDEAKAKEYAQKILKKLISVKGE